MADEIRQHDNAFRSLQIASGPGEAKTGPFKELLAAWSLVVVVLAVAGFSSRWNYYYNFGLQNLVWQAPSATLPIYAIEIIRNPENLLTLLWLALTLLFPFELILFLVRWASVSNRRGLQPVGVFLVRALGLRTALVVDAIRAFLIVYIAFLAGGMAGLRDYEMNVVETTSKLPKVTAISQGTATQDTALSLPIRCDARPLNERSGTADILFIGEVDSIKFLSTGGACDSHDRTWRLLFQDEKLIYLFATVPSYPGRRPQTLVLPKNDRVVLVLE